MPQNIGRLPRSKYNSLRVAESWLDLGIRTVPIKKNGKAPRSRKGWNTLRITKKTIPQFFKPSDNVGGLWGEPSNWVIDVDLDWDEAADIAELLLPDTFIYGRRSRPGTHFLYKCKGISSSKFALRTGEVIAEIRSTGSQSVLPPSMHPDSERYEINNDVEFVTLSEIQLRRHLSEVCIGAILIRYFPEGGSRHDYVHAVTGALMWSGWDEKRVLRFMDAFLTITHDYDDDSKQRVRTVKNTIDSYKRGTRVAGWKTISEWVDGKIIQKLREWSKVGKQLEENPQGSLLAPKKKAKAESQFPMRLANDVPGLVGEVTRWSAKQSFLVQPSFDLAVGLMCTALATCNKYKISGWNTPLQPYFMLLAPTAAGKGASLTNIYRFGKEIGLTDTVVQGFQSYHAMLDRLGEAPNMVCWLWDEAARRLASARSPGSMDYQIVSWLISLYGKADEHVPGFPGRKVEIPTLDRPFLTLLATAQPSQLIESVTSADLAMGLINRFVLFDSGDDAPSQNWDRDDIFPSSIKKHAMEIKQHEPKGSTTVITYSNVRAYKIFDNFFTLSRETASRGDEHEIWGRANQNALILAGLVAVGVSAKRPQITEEIARWAIDVVKWSINCWMTRIGETASRNIRESQSKKVEALIRRPKVLKTKKPKEQKLLNKGYIPRSVLLRSCRYLRSHELTDIMDQLIEADLVGMSEVDGHEVYWPKS